MDLVEEALRLVQRVRAGPGPAAEQHQQVFVHHERGSSFGRRVRSYTRKKNINPVFPYMAERKP